MMFTKSKLCDFDGIELTEKGVCRIGSKLLGLRFLSYLITIPVCTCILDKYVLDSHSYIGPNQLAG